MPYPSVDQLQKALTQSVFHYARDKKKAAGRALGTLVEVVTFYMLKSWDFGRHIAIERPLPEYSNEDITHNVEYSLHPSVPIAELEFPIEDLPISIAKIIKALAKRKIRIRSGNTKANQLLSSDGVLRNACTIADEGRSFLIAILTSKLESKIRVVVNRLYDQPFAIVECKRVGVEEGTRKGPQTIEKAKQGAYVARTVSALQRIRLPNGELGGVLVDANGRLIWKKYGDFIQEIVESDNPSYLRHFILTVGVVSNHGNWFTSDNHNKELKVLSQSYDWLLFLTDQGLAEFIQDLILHPTKEFAPVRKVFLASYKGKRGTNQFTKVQMAYSVDQLIQAYFRRNAARIETWFNVIAPEGRSLSLLRNELRSLTHKNWRGIHT